MGLILVIESQFRGLRNFHYGSFLLYSPSHKRSNIPPENHPQFLRPDPFQFIHHHRSTALGFVIHSLPASVRFRPTAHYQRCLDSFRSRVGCRNPLILTFRLHSGRIGVLDFEPNLLFLPNTDDHPSQTKGLSLTYKVRLIDQRNKLVTCSYLAQFSFLQPIFNSLLSIISAICERTIHF